MQPSDIEKKNELFKKATSVKRASALKLFLVHLEGPSKDNEYWKCVTSKFVAMP
jgi:hypothetical protein